MSEMCKKCKWYYKYIDWHYNGSNSLCHNGNQNDKCVNFKKETWWRFWA